MLLTGSHRVIVEVVHNERVPLGWQVDIQLQQQRVQRARRRHIGAQRKQDVSIILHKVEQDLRCQGGTERLQSGG